VGVVDVVDLFLTAAFSISFHRDLLHSTYQSTGTLRYANKYNREEASTYHWVLGLMIAGLLAWCLRLWYYLLFTSLWPVASCKLAGEWSFVFSDGLSALYPSFIGNS